MKDKQEILFKAIREGKSVRAISRDTGFHRATVRKYINNYDEEKRKLFQGDFTSEEEFISDIVEKPKYDSSTRKRKKVTPEMIAEISYCLEENRKKRSRGEHKQQMKSTDISEYLISKGYEISYSTVCLLVNNLTDHSAETFIKQYYEPGKVCEFDWGEVKLFLESNKRKLNMAVFTTAFEGWVYARVFPKQKTQDFQESHACFFAKLKGVHHQIVYDNMKVAVKRFVGRNEKEPTDALLKLSMFYGFDFRFCNAAAGNEKGHVERGVEYVRRKAFSKRNSFSSIEEANEYLEQICDYLNNKPKKEKQGTTAEDLLQIARPYLFPVQAKYDCAESREARVDKLSTICVDTCHYSVPEKYTGKFINVRISSNKIICFADDSLICKHNKIIGKYQWSMNIDHYLKTLIRKPGAVKGSYAFHQMDEELKSIYSRYFKEQTKDFIRLLIYIKENNKSIYEVKGIIEKLEQINPQNVNLQNIIALAERDVAPKQEYPDNDINESVNKQLRELAGLLPGNEQLYKGGKVL